MHSLSVKGWKAIGCLTLGAVLATGAIYTWSRVFCELLPFKVVSSANDEEALVRFFQSSFPQSGTYTIPAPNDDEEEVKELLEVGPVATLHVLNQGDISLKTKITAVQIGQIFATVCLLGWLLRKVRQAPSMDSYRLRVIFVALLGIAAAIYNDLADPIWVYHPWRWTLAKGLNHITSWTIAGLILGGDWFISFGMNLKERKPPA